MKNPDHDAPPDARLERLAEAHAAEYADDDTHVRWVLDRRFPCPRYFWRSRCEDGTKRLELADTPDGAQWAMAAFAQDCPAWWPASELLDLDTGVELRVDVSTQIRVAAPGPRRAGTTR